MRGPVQIAARRRRPFQIDAVESWEQILATGKLEVRMARRKSDQEVAIDEMPELDDAWFARARPASEVLRDIFPPEVAEEMLKPGGRPEARGVE